MHLVERDALPYTSKTVGRAYVSPKLNQSKTHLNASKLFFSLVGNKRFYDIYQMYQNDCEIYLNRSVADSEACMYAHFQRKSVSGFLV